MDTYLTTLDEVLDAAGDVLCRYYGESSLAVETKTSNTDLVTRADKESEATIKKILRERYPTHEILAEESGLDSLSCSEFRWVIDPLDGTTNFAHGVPIFAVSIALQSGTEIIAAGVLNPITKEKFLAEKGGGATLNGKPIHVSAVESLSRSLLVTGFPYADRQILHSCLREIAFFLGKVHGVLRLGAAALDLCYVACGRLEVFWQRNLHPWDTAAGWLIAEEAGGKVSDFSGRQFSPYKAELVCSNGKVHAEFLQWLRRAHEEPVF
jgi:myo-inositol-1(or 4)-monophosphatase